MKVSSNSMALQRSLIHFMFLQQILFRGWYKSQPVSGTNIDTVLFLEIGQEKKKKKKNNEKAKPLCQNRVLLHPNSEPDVFAKQNTFCYAVYCGSGENSIIARCFSVERLAYSCAALGRMK